MIYEKKEMKNNNWKIYMLTIICFVVGTTQFSIVGMLDKIAASVQVSVATAGQLVTIYALSNAIGTPLVVIAISKMNQRKQLLLAISIILLGIACMLVLPGFTFLMIARLILGVGSGVFIVNAYGIAAKLAAPGRQGSAMSNVAMGFSSSLVFGVPLGRIIAGAYGWKAIFWIIEFLCVVALMLSVTLFVFVGFSAIDTYITPFLTAVMPGMEDKISIVLMILGVGSLIGSKTGGFLADKIGINNTIFGAIIVQILALVIAGFSKWTIITIIALMIWEMGCWTFGPTQNFNLVSIAPEVSSIALSLNSTFVQIGFSLGSSIGGIAVGGWSVMTVTWIGVVSAVIAILLFGFARSLSKSA